MAGPNREVLEGGEADALNFIDEFKLNLFSESLRLHPHRGPHHLAGWRHAWTSPSASTRKWGPHRRQGEPQARSPERALEQRRPGGNHHLPKSGPQGRLVAIRGDRQRESKIRSAPQRRGTHPSAGRQDKLRKWFRKVGSKATATMCSACSSGSRSTRRTPCTTASPPD